MVCGAEAELGVTAIGAALCKGKKANKGTSHLKREIFALTMTEITDKVVL